MTPTRWRCRQTRRVVVVGQGREHRCLVIGRGWSSGWSSLLDKARAGTDAISRARLGLRWPRPRWDDAGVEVDAEGYPDHLLVVGSVSW